MSRGAFVVFRSLTSTYFLFNKELCTCWEAERECNRSLYACLFGSMQCRAEGLRCILRITFNTRSSRVHDSIDFFKSAAATPARCFIKSKQQTMKSTSRCDHWGRQSRIRKRGTWREKIRDNKHSWAPSWEFTENVFSLNCKAVRLQYAPTLIRYLIFWSFRSHSTLNGFIFHPRNCVCVIWKSCSRDCGMPFSEFLFCFLLLLSLLASLFTTRL